MKSAVNAEGDNMWNGNGYSLKLKENSVLDFEKIMLTSGECSLFMPMGFMSADEGETVCYDCSGFIPLSRYQIERTDDALFILENVVIILNRAVEYLLDPSKVTLNTDTVFYNKESGEVKITYVPLSSGKTGLNKNLVSFIGQLRSEISDTYSEYLVETAKYIYYYNYNLTDIVNKIGVYRREIYIMENKIENES